MDAHLANAPRRLVSEEIFGEVEYYITHEYDNLDRMFAYVQKIDRYDDDHGQIYFNRYSSFQFIEVIDIGGSTAFLTADPLSVFPAEEVLKENVSFLKLTTLLLAFGLFLEVVLRFWNSPGL